jgi:polysaccharide pyruvyl transferase WcaK-like protein
LTNLSQTGAGPLRVCLIMHSTRSDNLGVGALTVSEVAILRDTAHKLGRKIDIYGRGRLVRIFVMKFLTHLAGTPLVVAPQTIGPFTKCWSKRLARWSLNRSALVATRDAKSTDALRELGYRGAVIEASDVALRLPFDPPARSLAGPARVGINVSGLLMAGGYTGKNELGIALDYPGLIRNLIAKFQGIGAEVHLVPHVIVREGPMVKEDDWRASQALAAEFPSTVLAPAFASPSEAKSYIASLDFFIGARMHACIAAFSSCVPVVPMAYSRKFAGLFGSLGYDATVDCTTETAAAIEARIMTAWESQATLAESATAALARGRAKLALYEAALLGVLEQTRG